MEQSGGEDWRAVASATGPVNLAVIKYWGKRETEGGLNVPTNSSLSVTLSQDELCAHTTAVADVRYAAGSVRLWLNGREEAVGAGGRLERVVRALRRCRGALEAADAALRPLSTYGLVLVSANDFPTAAGLASSAAGYAALVRAVADLYGLRETAEELSVIAREGSGSACRSLLGGYVAWERGARADGADSGAVQVADAAHWPQMRAAILVVSAARKQVSSTCGMQRTVRTSGLFATRAEVLVPVRMAAMAAAVAARDFGAFAALTMQDSNTFHAVCLDTSPPIFYLNDVSRALIALVEGINAAAGRLVAAYTFDAGPNAVVFYLDDDDDAPAVLAVLRHHLPGADGWPGRPAPAAPPALAVALPDDQTALIRAGVARVILTRVGDGPRSTDVHLSEPAHD